MSLNISKELPDALNYGLYLPPSGGRAGKFLAEDRMVGDYGLPQPIAELEVVCLILLSIILK
jgi:SH3/ankyrin repeat-containing protein